MAATRIFMRFQCGCDPSKFILQAFFFFLQKFVLFFKGFGIRIWLSSHYQLSIFLSSKKTSKSHVSGDLKPAIFFCLDHMHYSLLGDWIMLKYSEKTNQSNCLKIGECMPPKTVFSSSFTELSFQCFIPKSHSLLITTSPAKAVSIQKMIFRYITLYRIKYIY